MNEAVRVTVAVTAHSRARYISRALESVFAQTLDSDQYEILIVTELSSIGVPPGVSTPRVRVYRTDEWSMGKKLAQALRLAQGPIVSFLDDDDLFTPNKLKWVVGQFETNSQLGLLHNAFTTMDDEERPISLRRPLLGQSRRRIEISPRTRLTARGIDELFRNTSNMSSLSLRREWVLPILNKLDRMEGLPEGFFAAGAVRQGVTIAIDPLPLTYYRVHTSSAHTLASDPLFIQRRAQYFRRGEGAMDELLDFTKTDPTMHLVVRSHRARWSLYHSLYDLGFNLSIKRINLPDLLRFIALDRGREAPWLVPLFILSRLFPGLPGRILRGLS